MRRLMATALTVLAISGCARAGEPAGSEKHAAVADLGGRDERDRGTERRLAAASQAAAGDRTRPRGIRRRAAADPGHVLAGQRRPGRDRRAAGRAVRARPWPPSSARRSRRAPRNRACGRWPSSWAGRERKSDVSTLVIRNLTPLRAIDAASASPAEILRLLGTAASDFSSGAYDGAQYLIANLSPLLQLRRGVRGLVAAAARAGDAAHAQPRRHAAGLRLLRGQPGHPVRTGRRLGQPGGSGRAALHADASWPAA